MFTTVTAVLVTTAAVLPGFLMAQIARLGRPSTAPSSDLDLVLRALGFAVLIHLAMLPWTAHLVRDVGGGTDWIDHLSQLIPYAAVLLLAGPLVVGLVMNRLLVWFEENEASIGWWAIKPGRWHRLRKASAGLLRGTAGLLGAFGGRAAPETGAILDAVIDGLGSNRLLVVQLESGGVFAASKAETNYGATPEDRELKLRTLWAVDSDGNPIAPYDPPRDSWTPARAITAVFVVERP